MNYLQRKKIAFISIVNQVKGFVRSVSGVPPLTLPDCVDEDSLISYTIEGNNVGDYDEETGKYQIPIISSGKNLFNINNLSGNSFVTNNQDGTITANQYSANSGAKLQALCPELKVGDTVRLSMKTSGNPLIYLNCGVNWNNGSKKTITQDMLNSNVYFYTNIDDKTTPVIISNIQVEFGDVTDYEPYHKPITTIIYLDEPLQDGEILTSPVKLPLFKGTTILSVDTEVQPSHMELTYYSTAKE